VRDSWRLSHNPNPKVADAYAGTVERQPNGQLDWTGVIRPLHDRLDWPLRWRKPRRIFVCNEADLFHPDVPEGFIAQVWEVMAWCPQHTFQVLTKRPERMRAILDAFAERNRSAVADGYAEPIPWPLPNVWCGTSAEDQGAWDARIPELLKVPAVVRFVSAEPLLGPIRPAPGELDGWCDHPCRGFFTAEVEDCNCAQFGRRPGTPGPWPRISWLIAGGESGPYHRPMDLDWVRALRDACVEAGTAFLFKQVGGRTPKIGGRLLDGRTWDEYPEGVAWIPGGIG
jgi:protein gp37